MYGYLGRQIYLRSSTITHLSAAVDTFRNLVALFNTNHVHQIMWNIRYARVTHEQGMSESLPTSDVSQ